MNIENNGEVISFSGIEVPPKEHKKCIERNGKYVEKSHFSL